MHLLDDCFQLVLLLYSLKRNAIPEQIFSYHQGF